MHELKREFEILMARMDDLLALLEAGSGTSAEILVPRLREQAAKTGALLDETIQVFRLIEDLDGFMPRDSEFSDDGGEDPEEATIGEIVSEKEKEKDEDEDEDEDGEEENEDGEEENEDDEEENDDDEGDSDDHS